MNAKDTHDAKMLHVIDDDQMVRRVLNAMLGHGGYSVLSFSSGDEYIEYMNHPEYQNPIAVLSDITMPGINGYELTLEIRKKYPFQIVVMISGNPDLSQHATKQACLIIEKPFYKDGLLSMLNDLVLPCHKHLTSENKKNSECVNAKSIKCPFCQQNNS